MKPGFVHQLRGLLTEEDWRNYHDIRRRSLWEERGRPNAYRDDYPDEYFPENHPRLFFWEGTRWVPSASTCHRTARRKPASA